MTNANCLVVDRQSGLCRLGWTEDCDPYDYDLVERCEITGWGALDGPAVRVHHPEWGYDQLIPADVWLENGTLTRFFSPLTVSA